MLWYSFVSKCYGGRSNYSFITNDCGFQSKLELGDIILADKKFLDIKTSCEDLNCILVIPPILHNDRFTEEEAVKTHIVASVRIHIEKVFSRLKHKYSKYNIYTLSSKRSCHGPTKIGLVSWIPTHSIPN